MAGAGNDQPRVIPVKAVLRGRPLTEREIAEGCEKCLEFIPDSNQVVLGGSKSFTFDRVFDANIDQEEFYDVSVKPLTEGVFKGYHATVFAYGQTGSGKTYSMGSAHNSTSYQNETNGIIPRVIADIFSGIDKRPEREFTVKVSYFELYKNDLYDLLILCPPSERRPIVIRDAQDGGTQITGLAELVVSNTEETLKVVGKGNSRRTTAATAMNLVSSRSHAIFTVLLESTGKEDPNDKISSKFHLVDLAGSERAKRTKAKGERLQEGIKINQGLLALGNVISALGDENQRSGHINYRDSKLTRILQGSLGGNSHTLMIACVSPADSNHEETLNTLRYADRVRKIKNKPVVNRDPQAALIVSLRQEIHVLRLCLLEKGNGDFQPSSDLPSGSSTDRNTTDKFKKMENKISNLEVDKENLMELLQASVVRHADMCEKAILAEMARDQLQEQLGAVITSANTIINEFPDLTVVGQHIEHHPVNDRYLKLDGLQKLVLKITRESAAGLDDGPSEEPDKENHLPMPNFNADEGKTDQSISAAYTMKNVDLSKQMQELSNTLSLKEELAKKMTSNDMQMLRFEYELKLQQLDKDIQNLAKEKANLELALEQAQKTKESRKLSEKCRQRVADLESQIQELKKERKVKEKLNRMKSKSELNGEIQEIKRSRIILVRQIKDENTKFKLWKKEKAREVKQLKEENRKRNFEYVKLERTYDKQKATLRRKTEEATAAHRRLKEAINKQAKSASLIASEKRTTMDGSGPRIKAWLDEEIEILTSMKEAKHHLNLLLDDRKVIARELQNSAESPRKKRTFDQAEFQNCQKEHEELRQEMKLKNAQIIEMQNKLADAKDNHTGNNRWTHIGTLLDAKCALKYLLQLIVSASIEDAKQKEAIEEGVKAREAAEEITRSLKIKMREMECKHQDEQTRLGHSHEDEISVLMTRLGSHSDDISVVSPEVLERVVTKQAAVIGTLKEGRKELHRKPLEQRTSVSETHENNEDAELVNELKRSKSKILCKGYGNATFNPDISDEAGPSKASTPTFPAMFPELYNVDTDKENLHPDIIPRTLMGAEDKPGPYKPVYFR